MVRRCDLWGCGRMVVGMSSEEVNQQRIRLMIANENMTPMRNNLGACFDKSGRLIRYGLMNDSKKLNENIKSSDLVLPRPMLITQEWVGHVLGVFAAIEVKESGWVYDEKDPHSKAQWRFHEIIRNAGGFAGFASSPEEARVILRLPYHERSS